MSQVNDIFRQWAKVTEQLTQAAALLGSGLDSRSTTMVRSFRDHLAKNEFEAAWDRLAEAGTLSATSAGFWERMSTAAQLLSLNGRKTIADEHVARLRR